MREFEPASMEWRDVYKLLIGAVVPRPIAFVSTVSADGVRNLGAFSFFNGVCPQPFIVAFAPMFRTSDGGKKDTLKNIEETGEFVINIVSEQLVPQMNATAPEFEPEVDEFEVSGLTPIPSVSVKPPRVAESFIHMECKKVNILQFGDGPGGGFLVLGEVVRLHVAESAYENGRILPDVLNAVGRMAGNDYTRTTDRFSLQRPTRA